MEVETNNFSKILCKQQNGMTDPEPSRVSKRRKFLQVPLDRYKTKKTLLFTFGLFFIFVVVESVSKNFLYLNVLNVPNPIVNTKQLLKFHARY